MKKPFCTMLAFFALIVPLIAQDDAEGSKDPALFTRMPNHYIYTYTEREYDRYEFPVSPDKKIAVEGHYIDIWYGLKEGAVKASGLQIVRNYQNAIKKIGGQVVYESNEGGWIYTTLKIVKDGKETWVYIAPEDGPYRIFMVEKQSMEQAVVADAGYMANSIKETGKVALYGIFFDTGKSILKPESESALQEIAKLISADPGLKLYVVGHTDNTGSFDANMKLSMDRAASVVNAMVSKHSINAASLKAIGHGPTSPVATNDTEEGKALNRRVELVKQ